MSDDTPPAVTPPPAPVAHTTPPPAPPAGFSAQYVQELRGEAEHLRGRMRAHETAAETAKREAAEAKTAAEAAIAAAKAEADQKVAAAAEAARERIIRAEMKAAAVRAGLLDLDALKLLDTSAVKMNDDGEVVIPEKFFEEAKKAKPYLFGAAQTDTSNPSPTPPPKADGIKLYKDMTEAERAAFRKANNMR